MHELGVVFHIMDNVEKVAQENKVEGISKVVLELGEVSTVIESYLQNCWKWAAKKRELFDGAELVVEQLPVSPTARDVGRPTPQWNMGKFVPTVKARKHGFCRGMNLI